MITCTFAGGLGNNIFQLATLYNLHKKYNVDYVIPSYVNRSTAEYYKQSSILEIDRLFDTTFNIGDLNLPVYIHTDMNGGLFEFTEIPFKDNTCYKGYFQSDKYFKDFDIIQEFCLNKKIESDLRDKYDFLFKKQTIAVHCRLAGDRIESQVQHYHKTVSLDYYKKAIEIITGMGADLSNYNILLFSDNIFSAIEITKDLGYNFIPIMNSDNVEDFIMMSLCDYNIIGNSTYTWWSAYFNKNAKKIIAPKSEWFGPGYKHFNIDDLFPKKWITI